MTQAEAIKFAEYAQIMAMDKPDVQEFYKLAEVALRQQEQKSPCSLCGYGGKHLDAPPCTACPAHPKTVEIDQFKNTPLTLEELREMDGEPVWIERCGSDSPDDKEWALVFVRGGFCRTSVGNIAYFPLYGIGWLAYRHKPEEASK